MMIDGEAHGPWDRSTTCQLHMRAFEDGDEILVEPFRSRAFPVVPDLMVDRSAFDRIIQAGGYVSVGTGSAPEANIIPVPKPTAELAFDAATCIGCGACVAQCPNGAAQLFTSAKVGHLNILPSGRAREGPARGRDGRADGGGALRKLLELPRVRSGLPEGHQHRLDRADEPRLSESEAEGRQEALRDSMKWTPQQERVFKETFAVRQRRQISVAIPLVIAMFWYVVAADEPAGTVLGYPLAVVGPLFLVFIVGALVFSLKNWRCPACDRYLGKVWNPRHCHSCGVALR